MKEGIFITLFFGILFFLWTKAEDTNRRYKRLDSESEVAEQTKNPTFKGCAT